jgi:hypothetical protein
MSGLLRRLYIFTTLGTASLHHRCVSNIHQRATIPKQHAKCHQTKVPIWKKPSQPKGKALKPRQQTKQPEEHHHQHHRAIAIATTTKAHKCKTYLRNPTTRDLPSTNLPLQIPKIPTLPIRANLTDAQTRRRRRVRQPHLRPGDNGLDNNGCIQHGSRA